MKSNRTTEPAVFWPLDRLLTWVSFGLGGLALASMTLLSVWNVLIMRKALNAPIMGAEDVLVILLVSIVAISIPLGARTGAHIEIEVLESVMPRWFAKWSHIFVKVMAVILLTVMAWRLWHGGQGAVRFGETTQNLMISYEPYYYLFAVSVAIYAFVLILELWLLVQNKKVAKLDMGRETL